jgi:hypothetical protein
MRTYRDAIDVIVIFHLLFETRGADLDLSSSSGVALFAEAQRHRAGTLCALKWGSQFCPENGAASATAPETLVDLLALGVKYEAFVDVLKPANHDAVALRVDEIARTLICYEGEQATVSDTSIIMQQRLTAPLTRQISLTEDGDQITDGWRLSPRYQDAHRCRWEGREQNCRRLGGAARARRWWRMPRWKLVSFGAGALVARFNQFCNQVR